MRPSRARSRAASLGKLARRSPTACGGLGTRRHGPDPAGPFSRDDRIRCIRNKRFKYIRNFFPNLPYTQTNLYKIRQYPVLTLMQVLHARGELEAAQARFMVPARPAEELYDLQRDPHEVRDLAGDPGHREVLRDLRARLDAWIRETGDRGEEPEDPRIAARVFVNRHMPGHRRTMRSRGLAPDASPAEYLRYWEKALGIAGR